VVKIETSVGTGSGFFVTDTGYLITNRHVVRPSSSTQWKQGEEILDDRKAYLDNFRAKIRDDAESLKEMKAEIDEYKDYMASNKVSERDRNSYERYLSRYDRNREKHEENQRNYREKEKEYNSIKSEFGWNTSLSNFSKKFTIVLKNEKIYRAAYQDKQEPWPCTAKAGQLFHPLFTAFTAIAPTTGHARIRYRQPARIQ